MPFTTITVIVNYLKAFQNHLRFFILFPVAMKQKAFEGQTSDVAESSAPSSTTESDATKTATMSQLAFEGQSFAVAELSAPPSTTESAATATTYTKNQLAFEGQSSAVAES